MSSRDGSSRGSRQHIDPEIRPPLIRVILRLILPIVTVVPVFSAIALGAAQSPAAASGSNYSIGDVFVATATGTVLHYNSAGQSLGSLSTGSANNETGMCLDATSHLYVANFAGETMSKFDSAGNLMPYPYESFSSTYPASNPESCTVNAAGDLFVGVPEAPCSPACPSGVLEEFSPTGALLHTWRPTVENVGVDWIDLASDQCTLYYTSEGSDILRFNVCTGQQESNFASNVSGQMWAMRIRADGGVVATDSVYGVVRFNSAGQLVQTYPFSSFKNPDGTSAALLFALTLDPDGSSFWAAAETYGGEGTVTYPGEIYKMNISTGALETSINTGQPQSAFGTTGGLVTYGGPMPLGGALAGAVTRGGGSPSVACSSCGGQGAPAQPIVGAPVNTATGDFYESSTDLSVSGPGIPLGLTRTYDAETAQAGTSGPFGSGWSYNLGPSLAYNSKTGVVTLSEENGAQTVFNAYSSSVAWCSSTYNFCPSSPRTIATLNHNLDKTWTFTRDVKGTQIFTFASSGVLTKMADPAGDTLTWSSESAGTGRCPSGRGTTCTLWTSSSSGRNLTLQFNISNQLVAAFGYAPSGSTPPSATFCYYGQSCAPGLGGLSGDLYSATDPGGLTTTYTYDTTNSNGSLRHDLLTRTGPATGATLSNAYDTSGRVTSQTDPFGAVTTLSYSGDPTSEAGSTTTVTTYPQGQGSGKPSQQVAYQFSDGELIAQTSGTGSTVSSDAFVRDPVSGLASTAVDGNGNPSGSTFNDGFENGGSALTAATAVASTDALGNTTQSAYTPVSTVSGAPPPNLVYCSVDAAHYTNGVRCPTSPSTTPPTAGSGKSTTYLGAAITYYDSAGNPTAVTDARGYTSIAAYTTSGSGVPLELAYCTVDAVEYSTSGITCPSYGTTRSGAATSTFDGSGDVVTSTDPTGGTTAYVYGNTSFPNLPTTVTDPDKTVTTNTYDNAGRLTKKVMSFGSYSATTVTAYDSAGRVYCSIAPLGFSQGAICPAAPSSPPTPGGDPWPGTTITIFDHDNRPLYRVNPLGGVTQTAYDQSGNAFCTVGAVAYAQGTTCPATEPSTRPSPGSDSYLGATIDTFDALGRLVQVTNPLGGITLTSYDGTGNKTQQIVESNNTASAPNITTAYSYDADNRVISTTIGAGSSSPATTLTSYDPNGNTYCTVSANAVAAGSSTYQCPPWQTAWIAAPPNPSALYSSAPTSSQANNVTTSFSDALGNVLQSTTPVVATMVNALDADGRVYCSSDPVNMGSWLSAHPSGVYPYLCPASPPSSPPAQGSNPGYSTTIFDAEGRTLAQTDQVGDTTAYTYDPAGNQATMKDPRGNVTSSCYYWQNGSGQCAVSALGGGGSGDDLYSQTTPATNADPAGEVTLSSYYPGDEVHTTTTPAGTTTSTYDAQSDLLSQTYSNTAANYSTPTNTSYTYYQDGSRHTMIDGTGTTTYAKDDVGDVTQKAFTAGGGTGLSSNTVNYGFFSTGVESSVTYPSYTGHTNPAASYTYNALGNMASETDWLGNTVTFSHDANGNLTTQANAVSISNLAGTSSTTFSYDKANRMTQSASSLTQTCSSSTETLTQTFNSPSSPINADGQVTQDSETYANSCSGQTGYQRNYNFDLAGRVDYQGSTPQGGTGNNYAYDPSGDPTTISSHDPHGIYDTYNQAFDSAGEAQGQQPVTGSQGISSTYSYDTIGDRTSTSSSLSTSTYGFDQLGRMTSASQALGVTQVAEGIDSMMALRSDGTVWNWGNNGGGQLGNGTTTSSAVPLEVPGLTGVVTIAGGEETEYAVKSDGTLWAWGANYQGSLGDGNTTESNVPVEVTGLTGVKAVAAGYDWALALKSDGTVWAWGEGIDGELGNGATTNSSVPVEVSGLTGVTTIAAGNDHGLALKSDGTVWAWGGNYYGELGNGNTTNSDVPVQVSALSGGPSVIGLSASGNEASFALKSDGTVWSWGYNHEGELGNGNTTNSDVPVQVSGLSGVKTIAADGDITLALKSDGTVWDWGANSLGELGNGNHNNSDVPVQVNGVSNGSAIAAGIGYNGLVLEANGTLWTWGYNQEGQLGNGTLITNNGQLTPVAVTMSGINAPVTTSYVYNGDGLNGGKTFAGSTTTFTWGAGISAGPALTLSDGTNDYVYGPTGEPVEQINVTGSPPANNPLFMTFTPSDSSWLLTNVAGDQVSFYRYDAFGTLSSGVPGSPFGYAGQYTDATTGFSNMRARWYEPHSGQFTTRDPAYASTDTAYGYASDDPVNQSDPSGEYTHGYCLSETAAAFYSLRPPVNYVSQSAMACLEEDGHNNLALVTSAAFATNTETSTSQIVSDYLSAGLASAGIAFDVLNTNANTVFGGLQSVWQSASGGASLFGYVGISGEILYKSATNGSGYLYGAGVGVALPGSLPISFATGGITLNSVPIRSASQRNDARQLISTIDTFDLAGVFNIGEGGVPWWLLNVFGLGGFPYAPGPIGQRPPEVNTVSCVPGVAPTEVA